VEFDECGTRFGGMSGFTLSVIWFILGFFAFSSKSIVWVSGNPCCDLEILRKRPWQLFGTDYSLSRHRETRRNQDPAPV
jgi:hypothetical protein